MIRKETLQEITTSEVPDEEIEALVDFLKHGETPPQNLGQVDDKNSRIFTISHKPNPSPK